ncbi:ZIP family metal transporter [Candidatus Nanohalococcus occultus]|uniref:Divalent heavy-metal cations transporter n=1 Tax=Candidatus Nanohalococcus occultus TaxID=2978047 RepID=A0ABY8CII2_9ARCH|nr:Putative divalent heavy-metal cations transporter [Candidatus Nanohaloarchaeota archaeon SVXNc]
MVQQTILLSLIVTSLFSALGASFLYTSKENFEKMMPYMISLSAGSIFGGVFIHLIFRLSNKFSYGRITGLLILAGMGGSFVLERLVHWHCHHGESHEDALPYVLAVGDSFHNVLDGVLIATSFLASTSAGIAATVAIIAHKVPKELGDFGVMVNGGFSRLKALGAQLAISIFMFVGAGLVVGVSSFSRESVPLLLPLVVGNFVYIAGSDLLPQFKHDEAWIEHLTVFSLGVLIMYLIPYLKAAV